MALLFVLFARIMALHTCSSLVCSHACTNQTGYWSISVASLSRQIIKAPCACVGFFFTPLCVFPSVCVGFPLSVGFSSVFVYLQEIDGESLLTLDPEMMVNCMNIKTGPALKIHKHILDLKRTYNISTF